MGFSAKQVQALRRNLDQPSRPHARGQWPRTLLHRRLVCDLGSQPDLRLRWLESRDSGFALCARARKPRHIPRGLYRQSAHHRSCRRRDDRSRRPWTGEGRGTSPGEVHDIALKAAETDATKRALATFGKPSGLNSIARIRTASSNAHRQLSQPLQIHQHSRVSVFTPTIRPRSRGRRTTTAAATMAP